jgi:phosphoserine aminotransferase
VHGHRLVDWPEHPNLVVDSSSEMMSRPHPVARTALVYAGAQKNLGPAGVVLTIVRQDLYDRIGQSVPKIFSFKALAEAKSCLNTPPTFGVYFLLETFRGSSIRAASPRWRSANAEKAALIYGAIDSSGGFYRGTVADHSARSHMNVTFMLPSEELTEKFVKDASKNGMVALKGYGPSARSARRCTTPCPSPAPVPSPTSWPRSRRRPADRRPRPRGAASRTRWRYADARRSDARVASLARHGEVGERPSAGPVL